MHIFCLLMNIISYSGVYQLDVPHLGRLDQYKDDVVLHTCCTDGRLFLLHSVASMQTDVVSV